MSVTVPANQTSLEQILGPGNYWLEVDAINPQGVSTSIRQMIRVTVPQELLGHSPIDAIFSGGMLTISVLQVGSDFYRVELPLSNADTLDFQVGDVQLAIDPEIAGIPTFNNDVLYIPEVVVGPDTYSVELTLVAVDPFTFRITAAQLLTPGS